MEEAAAIHRTVLHRITDKYRLQIKLFYQAHQPDGSSMAEHRAFVDDDAAAASSRLHLLID